MSIVLKRSIVIGGHKTSVSLEDEFWREVKEIALAQQTTVSKLVEEIDSSRANANLSSAVRLYVLTYYRDKGLPRVTT